nr:zinc ribbon domain-containing protein [Candidatus Sigynarchaeota archaeon]
MATQDPYWRIGKKIQNLMYFYIFSLIGYLIYTWIGFVLMLLYLIIIILLAIDIKNAAAVYSDASLGKAWIFLLAGSITCIAFMIVFQVIPVEFDAEYVLNVLNTVSDPMVALDMVAPYIASPLGIMVTLLAPELVIPPVLYVLAWNQVNQHVSKLDDMKKHIALEGLHKILVGQKAFFAAGAALAGCLAIIYGVFQSIAITPGPISYGTLAPLGLAGILALFGIIVVIVAFFYLMFGYYGAGSGICTLKSGQVQGERALREQQRPRCAACGNPVPTEPSIKFCPVCGAKLD